jgi:hypothetical protein
MVRNPTRVAQDHIAAVLSGDPAAMAADYAPDAVLERADGVYEGHDAIKAYFNTVPARLGSARVVFDELLVTDNTVTFRWHLDGSDATASGTDVCILEDGLIVHQIVRLNAVDF